KYYRQSLEGESEFLLRLGIFYGEDSLIPHLVQAVDDLVGPGNDLSLIAEVDELQRLEIRVVLLIDLNRHAQPMTAGPRFVIVDEFGFVDALKRLLSSAQHGRNLVAGLHQAMQRRSRR